MQIKYLGDEKFEIKAATAKVNLSRDGVQIEDFKVSSPGEFEHKGVSVQGIDPDEGNDTIYLCTIEDMTLLYPALLKEKISEEAAKEIGDVDILIVPLGEEDSLKAKEAQKLISEIDPRIVIPMLYSDIHEFKTAEGITDGEIDVLKIKKVDLPQEERKFYILKPNG